VKTKLEVDCEVLQDTYLGMPTETAREITSSFRFLPKRVWKCLNSCSGRTLSRAGKEAWLKALVQATPNYVMSCFHVPVATSDKMRSGIVNHWWDFEDGKKKIH
jgi:hypothetical protein